MDRELIATLKLLSDVGRLRLVGQLAAGPANARELADALRMPIATVIRQVGLLRRFALVRPVGERFELRLDTLQSIGRRLDELEARAPLPLMVGPDGRPLPDEDAKVLRGYLDDGRLTTIPATERKRRVVVRWLRDQVFTEDRGYPEKEVNQRLALYHPDVASLRRYMVDSGLATRERGVYRRAGAEGE
jgi:hypothetical protein